MRRISFELDGATVSCFGDQAAARRAFTTRRRVVGRDAGNRFVGRDEIRYELLDVLLEAADRARGGAGDAEDLEEVAAFDAR